MLLIAVPVRLKDLFDPQLKNFRHLKGKREARIVLTGFDRVNGLAAYSEPRGELRLRPFAIGSKNA